MIRNLVVVSAVMSLAACVPPSTPGNPDGAGTSSSSSSSTVQTSSPDASTPASSSSSSESSVSSPGSNPGAGVIFTEDFESGSEGAVPSGWDTFTGYVPNQNNANQSVSVTSARAHSGSKSLHVASGTGPSQILKRLPSDIDQLYMRAWFYMDRSMGNDPTDNHEHIMGTKKDENGSFSANNEIRIGQGKGHLGFNLVPESDAISPTMEKWNSGPSTPVNQWYCVEAGFDPSKSYDELYMWVDGVQVNAVQDASDWHAPVGNSWMDGLLGYAFFGWHSFSGHNVEMWIDDIVVSSEPIGCN